MTRSRVCMVTGGGGFIGSHLVGRLLEDGHRVKVIDNFLTGHKENLPADGDLEVIEADVADYATIAPHFLGVQEVYHLAALADIVPSIEHPLVYHRTNVDGTAAALEASRHAGVRRFVYAASSSCYGIPQRYPTAEDAPIVPEYPYAVSKYLGEQLALSWCRIYRLPVISLRLFNVFGPRARTSGTYGAVFGVFLAQKLAGEPFTVVGDGRQTRDFTYVSDVVGAFVAAAESHLVGEVFNVGSGDHYSVNRLTELLGGEVVHVPRRPGEPLCTFADIDRIRTKLGWEPRVRFEEGVARVMERIEDWREAPVWTPQSIERATRDWFRYLGADQPEREDR